MSSEINWDVLGKFLNGKGIAHELSSFRKDDDFQRLYMIDGSSGVRYVSRISEKKTHIEILEFHMDQFPKLIIFFEDSEPEQVAFDESEVPNLNFTARERSLLIGILTKIRQSCAI